MGGLAHDVIEGMCLALLVALAATMAWWGLGCASRDPTMAQCGVADWGGHYPDTDYDISPSVVTPAGLHVDTSGQDVDLAQLDRDLLETRDCLLDAFPDLRIDDPKGAVCYGRDFRARFDRVFAPDGCWSIKIVGDSVPSCVDPGQRLLPIRSGGGGCEAKGLSPTETCPCRYRMTIQDNAIVLPPGALLLRDALVRMATACSPWGHPDLARCATRTGQE